MSSITTRSLTIASESITHQAPIRRKIRPDAEQLAWVYLLKHRTQWGNDSLLRSQARSSLANAARAIIVAEHWDRRTILSSLEWARLEQPEHAPAHPADADDDECLSFSAVRLIHHRCKQECHRVLVGQCDDWISLVTAETFRACRQRRQTPASGSQFAALITDCSRTVVESEFDRVGFSMSECSVCIEHGTGACGDDCCADVAI